LAAFFGRWWYGLAGAALWTAAPGLVPMSIQLRPDVSLAILSVVTLFLLSRAVTARSAGLAVAAAALIGFAVSLKLSAAALLVPLVVSFALIERDGGWRTDARGAIRSLTATGARRGALVATAGAWLALAIAFNAPRIPFRPTAEQAVIVVGALSLWAAYVALVVVVRPGLRAFRPVYAFALTALYLGVALPATLVLDDGLQSFVWIANALAGRGVNEGIRPFARVGSFAFLEFPLVQALVVFALGIVGAAVAAVRRDLIPALWAVGATAAAIMGAARFGPAHYFAPAFVLAIPPALSLTRRADRAMRSIPLATAALVAAVVAFQFEHVDDPAQRADREQALAEALTRSIEPRLRVGEMALVEEEVAHPDVRFWRLVQLYYPDVPHDYRLVLDDGEVLRYARGKRPRLYLSRSALAVEGRTEVATAAGRFLAERVPAPNLEPFGLGVLELVARK
jgi:hypothetical protein